MGAHEFLNYDRRHRRRDGLAFKHRDRDRDRDDDDDDAPITKPLSRAKLIITPLDSHRREAFASYPSGNGSMTTVSVDECERRPVALFWWYQGLTVADIHILRKEELCLKITPDVDHPSISVVFPMSMHDPDLFKCLLVGAQSLHDWRRDPFHVNRSSDMLKLQNEAILSLRKRLTAPEAHLDDGLLISITHLMVADVCYPTSLVTQTQSDSSKLCRRDLASLIAHLKGARQIMTLRGGLGNSPAHLSIRAIVTM